MKYSVLIWILVGILAVYPAWFLCSWLILILFCLTVPMKKHYEKPSAFYRGLLNYGYWVICRLGRVKVFSTGLEKIPSDKRFLLVSNHRSKFDNMIQSLCLRKENVAYISKKENFKIPIGRHYMNRTCYLSLDRENMKSGIEVIEKASHFLSDDISSVGLFPEGTRSTDTSLLPFHDACFRIAAKSGCPIVIGITQGTENIHKNWPFKKTKVTFDVVSVLEAKDYEGKKSVEISDMVRNAMLERLEKS